MVLRIGLLVGREWSFPPVFIEQVKRRHEGVIAEFAMLGGTRLNEPCPYALLIDRVSHHVPYYRSYLKHAVLQGVPVINNPFLWSADDRFFQAALAASLGIAVPRTLVLPNKDYGPVIVHAESLRNLIYPLDWDAMVEYVGLPCVLKEAYANGRPSPTVCHSVTELIARYNASGQRTLIVQQLIPGGRQVRCLCVGPNEVLPLRYDPGEHKYLGGTEDLDPGVRRRVADDSLKLARALGYDLNAVDWTVHEGTPYVLDCMNPAPPLDVNHLTPAHFDWVVRQMVDLAIRLAKDPPAAPPEPRWTPPLAQRA